MAAQCFAHCKCTEGCACGPQCSCIDELYDDYMHPCVTIFEEGLDKCRTLPYFNLEAIYWLPQQGPLFDLGLLNSSNQVTILLPHYTMRWGFKIGGGLYIEEIAANLEAKYTWFDNQKNKGKYSFYTTDSTIYAVDKYGDAYANFFNRVDLTLSRTFCAHDLFQFSSKAGLLLGFDRQWFDIKEEQAVATTFTDYLAYQKWWGIGPYAGFETDFRLPFCIPNERWVASIFFNAGGSLPWTNTNATYNSYDYVDSATNPGPVPAWSEVTTGTWRALNTGLSANFWTTQILAEMSLGLKYEGIIGNCDRGVKLSLFASWEEQYWPNHIMNLQYDETIDYQMQGLTFGGSLQY